MPIFFLISSTPIIFIPNSSIVFVGDIDENKSANFVVINPPGNDDPHVSESQSEYNCKPMQIEVTNDEEPILEMYRLIPIEDKEEIKIMLLHKFGRTEYGHKKKIGLYQSGHGEEAAAYEVISKKMA
jgi:hypothetical protein